MSSRFSAPRVALAHEWLVTMRGGERVLEALCELFPDAPLFTLVHAPGSTSPLIENRPIHTSFLQRMPMGVSRYRHYLPLMPPAVESLDVTGYDLVVSSSFCVMKGLVTRPDATHVTYCHTPMRYVWEQQNEYFGPGRAGALTRGVATLATSWLRHWDEASARRVDHYVANSAHIARRIRKRYGQEADVVHPPVDCARFDRVARETPERGDYYVMLGAFAPYKRVDLAIEAFTRLGKRLLIAGAGQDAERLRARLGPGGPVELLGEVPSEQVPGLLAGARAFVFPGEEDFGIAPVEAQACGTPVIAFGRGGALETVVGIDDAQGRAPTGVFFEEQTVDALADAVERFERVQDSFDPDAIRRHAQRFDRPRFLDEMRRLLAPYLGTQSVTAAS